ncbi:GMC family oxidoreductase [Massilia sp. R2A-15]|uniref:GMC oxidoreductase n=1 Tax=Massilia sp. R2A-15 TaxID=3064278 RepID=UPI0027331437|nr:GMC family oxidoreductase [Massilia sp. R2A-15]WLI91108.1 GMC family oxidoreductase [Massilia sp. R2A-15]
MNPNHYDIVIIGSGAGGGTLALSLAPEGKRILIIERGDFLRREQDNWNPSAVFVQAKYQSPEIWRDGEGRAFRPGIQYYVGGNTKFYGAALLRLRAEDFGEILHHGGVSPAWPVSYAQFEPYYCAAEALFHVHGARGADPTEPPSSRPYPYPPVSHEPRIAELATALTGEGLHPFPLPLGILLDEHEGKVDRHSPCIRCDAFDGFPCLLGAKADAQTICLEPALTYPNVTLLTNAYVEKLGTDAGGRNVNSVHVRRGGASEIYSGDIVVVACGAINSAALLLRSASPQHPTGLANSSDVVGRHYMRHNNSAFMAVSRRRNDTVFQKTLAINDYYFGAPDWEYPLGHIQMLGKSHGATMAAELPAWLPFHPELALSELAGHAIDFWLTSEDLPDPANRVTLADDGGIVLNLAPNNMEGHHRLREKLREMLDAMDCHPHLLPRNLYLGKDIPIGGTAHQNGTIRFGSDPATSALDVNCKAHDLDNLYVVDASFFVSCGAVNPSLTIIANALRVADHLRQRMR